MKNNKGITLIALIITIIVMLILVSVTVSIVVNSNLIGTSQKAGADYKAKEEEERNMGKVTIDGVEYASIEEYRANNPIKKYWYYCTADGTESATRTGYVTYKAESDTKGTTVYQIGQEVAYTPTELTTAELDAIDAEVAAKSGLAEYNEAKSTSEEQISQAQDDGLEWRIFDIKDKKLRVISNRPSETKVKVAWQTPQENNLLDLLCAKLYSVEGKASATNLNPDDIRSVLNSGVEFTNHSSYYEEYFDTWVDEHLKFPMLNEEKFIESGNVNISFFDLLKGDSSNEIASFLDNESGNWGSSSPSTRREWVCQNYYMSSETQLTYLSLEYDENENYEWMYDTFENVASASLRPIVSLTTDEFLK